MDCDSLEGLKSIPSCSLSPKPSGSPRRSSPGVVYNALGAMCPLPPPAHPHYPPSPPLPTCSILQLKCGSGSGWSDLNRCRRLQPIWLPAPELEAFVYSHQSQAAQRDHDPLAMVDIATETATWGVVAGTTSHDVRGSILRVINLHPSQAERPGLLFLTLLFRSLITNRNRLVRTIAKAQRSGSVNSKAVVPWAPRMIFPAPGAWACLGLRV